MLHENAQLACYVPKASVRTIRPTYCTSQRGVHHSTVGFLGFCSQFFDLVIQMCSRVIDART
eukprot:5215183-Pyramimonas_sp.AAC.1